jgi:SWI/SNF-related matrix-associated actin-dependent regulator of chromatin subfamily A-like protein 1
MLGRGIPIKKDNYGYNKADYIRCRQYLYGMTSKQLADVCRRLIKYARTQLDLDIERLKQTALYFEQLSTKERGTPVTVEIREQYVAVSFPFNRKFVPIIKRIEGHRNLGNDTWLIPTSEIFSLLNRLKEQGANVQYAISYLSNHLNEKEEKAPFNKQPEKVTIKVRKIGDFHIALRFSKQTSYILGALKKINKKTFNNKYQCWIIHIDEISSFIQSLDPKFVDYSTLLKVTKEKPNDQRVPVSGHIIEIDDNPRYIRLYFEEGNKEILQKINGLRTKRYETNMKFWYIHKLELPVFIEELEKIPSVDPNPLKKLLPKENKEIPSLNPKLYSHLERKPYKHQLEAALFLLRIKKGILAHEMGGGKTFSSILAAAHLKGSKLVVCPASLKINWKKEIEMVRGEKEKIVIINGSNWKDCGENGWCIINWDILDRHVEQIIKKKFICGIFDECHYARSVKNDGKPGSRRARMYIKITGYLPYVFALSGTPILNYTKDIFNQLVVTEHPESMDFMHFAKTFCDAKYNGYGWNVNGSSNEELLNEELSKIMLRAKKEEMLDLPEKIRYFIPVEVNLKNYYQRVEEYMKKRLYLSEDAQKLVELNKMRKEIALEKVQHTIHFTKELLERKEQVVIFTSYTSVVEKILDKFGDKATKITGDCTLKQREEAKVQFQNGEKQVIVCNFIAAGVGVTLTKSSNLIMNDLDWIPANMLQAEDRCHRIGQTRKTNIYYLYTEASVEKTMVELLSKKLKAISKNIDGEEEDIYETLLNRLEQEYHQLNIAV